MPGTSSTFTDLLLPLRSYSYKYESIFLRQLRISCYRTFRTTKTHIRAPANFVRRNKFLRRTNFANPYCNIYIEILHPAQIIGNNENTACLISCHTNKYLLRRVLLHSVLVTCYIWIFEPILQWSFSSAARFLLWWKWNDNFADNFFVLFLILRSHTYGHRWIRRNSQVIATVHAMEASMHIRTEVKSIQFFTDYKRVCRIERVRTSHNGPLYEKQLITIHFFPFHHSYSFFKATFLRQILDSFSFIYQHFLLAWSSLIASNDIGYLIL